MAASRKRSAPGDEADETWHCNRCDTSKPVGKFSRWAVRTRNHICRTCAGNRSREAHELRRGSLDRSLMGRLRKNMHKAGWTRSQTFKLDLSTMQELVRLQGGRSIFTGVSDPERLTVARWDRSRPWCFANLVLLTHAEAREHNRRTLRDYHRAYVRHVETRLLLPANGASDSAEQEEPAACPSYPPKSSHKRGLTSEVAMWYLEHFRVMYPTLRSSSHAARADLAPRVDEPLKTTAVAVCYKG
jgi:hypothetical protein